MIEDVQCKLCGATATCGIDDRTNEDVSGDYCPEHFPKMFPPAEDRTPHTVLKG